MKTGPLALQLIHASESCRLTAYKDSGGVWTIGWGTIQYPDGRPVAPGDTATQEEADAWFARDLRKMETAVTRGVTAEITPRQFGALICFTYNVGTGAFARSTVRKRVNADPNDPTIREALMRWHYDNGKPVKGLWNRRHREADFYFDTVTPVPPMPA